MKIVVSRVRSVSFSANTLKIIAVAAMLVDHLGAAFFPLDDALGFALRIVGRLTAPIMCFFIAEGYHHTTNLKRYASRLGIFALISHLPFYFAWQESFPLYLRGGLAIYPTSVMYPLLLGLLALALWHKPNLKKGPKVAGIIALSAFALIGDWGPLAVLWVLAFGIYRKNYKKQAAAFAAITLFYSLVMMTTGFGFPEQKIMGVIQIPSLFTLLLLRRYNGQRGGGSGMKWFFYWFYPLHLALIGTLKRLPFPFG